MADSNYGNRNAAVQISDDDPFAELTRIMGQMPQTEAATDELDEASKESSDPFELDLERELIGEFEAEPADSYAPEAANTFGSDSFAETVPFDLDGGDALSEPVSDAPIERQSRGDAENFWTRQPAAGSPADFDTYAPSESGETAQTDDLLADMDMDFDDLEAESGPVAEAPAYYEPDISKAAAPHDVSLEDELEMLLGSGTNAMAAPAANEMHDDAPDEADLVEAPPEPAQSWHQSIFGRANRGLAGGAHDEVPELEADSAAWDEIAHSDIPADAPAVPGADSQHDSPGDPFEALAHMADMPGTDDAHESRYSLDGDGNTEIAAPAAAIAPIDVDTVDVPEMALAQQDDLYLPELPLDDEPHASATAGDMESEFGYDFPTPGMRASVAPENSVLPGNQGRNPSDGNDIGDDDFFNAALGAGAAAASVAGDTHAYAGDDTDGGYGADRRIDNTSPDGSAAAPYEHQAQMADQPQRRTGFIVAGAVLAIAVLGGIGAFALSFGGGENAGGPVLVKADDEPLKVKPENPGGETAVPNQDSVAYEAASGSAASEKPQQESLVSTVEEPVNIASRMVDTNTLPGVDDEIIGDDPIVSVKAEDRLDASANPDSASIPATDIVAVQPRRVRTMIVRPDGTLVPREDAPVEEVVAAPAAKPAMLPATSSEATPTIAAAKPQPLPLPLPGASEPVTVEPEPVVAEAQPEPLVAPRTVQTTPQRVDPVTPRTGPILPSRPATPTAAAREQQVAQAAAVRPQPAAVPATTATASSEWSMQIASQPSSEGAQATYQELARRYANILDGRGVNIIRAEIPGKGTYYRVRVPSSSRNEGVALCERYKAAGGSCFVSK